MQLLHTLTFGIGLIGVAIILWGVLTGVRGFVRMELSEAKEGESKGIDRDQKIEVLRRDLGTYLLLGLEFLIAADIVNTIVKPSIDELIVLGSIVAIRTVLTYSLDKEVTSGDKIKDSKEATKR